MNAWSNSCSAPMTRSWRPKKCGAGRRGGRRAVDRRSRAAHHGPAGPRGADVAVLLRSSNARLPRIASGTRRRLRLGFDPIADRTDGHDGRPADRLELRAQAREVRLEPQGGPGPARPASPPGPGAGDARPGHRPRGRAPRATGTRSGVRDEHRVAHPCLMAPRVQRQRVPRPERRPPRPTASAPVPAASTRRITAAIRASSSWRPNGLTR